MHKITDDTIEEVEILAKLQLNEQEKRKARKDMEKMLQYFDCLNELDTAGIEPLSHVNPVQNVMREDVIMCEDFHEQMLKNAPEAENGQLRVPVTV